MRARVWIVALAAAAVGGCGGEPTLSSGAAKELHAQVADVREAAGDGDRDGALQALDGLQARVRELQDAGSLAEADASALRRGIGRARRRVRAELTGPAATATAEPTATATATATAVPAPEAPEPGGGDDEAKGRGETQGKGQEKDKDKGKEGDD